MACYKHETKEPVASCPCGRSLCRSCSDRFEPLSCEMCALFSVQSLRREIYRDFAITAVLLGLGFLVVESSGQPSPIWLGLLMGYLYAGARAGWITLGRLAPPTTTLAVPLFVCLALQVLRLLGAVMIGGFVLPIRLGKELLSLKRLADFTNQVNSPAYCGPKLAYSRQK